MAEQKNNNQNTQMIVIVVLLVVIAVLAFFLGKNTNTNTTGTTAGQNEVVNYEDLTITVIDDKRCTNCPTDAVLEQLNLLPSVQNAEMVKKDFSDEGVEEYLKENAITTLPLIVFSTKSFDVSADPIQPGQNGQAMPKVNTFLQELPGGEFSLPIGATFNPFEKRSDRGFLQLDMESLKQIKDNSYIKGNENAKITWLEYSDLECPFCAKLHNAGTDTELVEKYGDDLNVIFNHFPLGFHANAQPGAEIMECLAEEKGVDAFYALMKKSFSEEKSSKSFLIDEAVALGADEDSIEECLDSGKYTSKVKDQMARGTNLFGVTGTPGNVLINNETGEYEVISGAYPTSAFVEVIDKLLAE